MKSKVQISARLHLGIGFALFPGATTICHAQTAPTATKSFLIFHETKSPDGQYAVAWGLPKHADTRAKGSQFDKKYPAGRERNEEASKEAEEVFERVNSVAHDVENHIVKVCEEKIVCKLDCPRTPGINRELEPE